MQNAQIDLSKANLQQCLHLPDSLTSDHEEGLSVEHLPLGFCFLDFLAYTGSVHVVSPHHTHVLGLKFWHWLFDLLVLLSIIYSSCILLY